MYLAGFLEGFLTKKQTYIFLDNSSVRKSRDYPRLAKFFYDVDSSLEKRLNSQEFVEKLNETESKYWIQVKSIFFSHFCKNLLWKYIFFFLYYIPY